VKWIKKLQQLSP